MPVCTRARTHTQKQGMISTLEVDADDHKFTVTLTQPGLCETLSQKSGAGNKGLGDDSVGKCLLPNMKM